MITAEEALKIINESGRARRANPGPLSDRQKMQLDYLDASLEATVHKNPQPIQNFPIPKSMVDPHAVAALMQLWESGGWHSAAFPSGDDINVIFAIGGGEIKSGTESKRQTANGLPPVCSPFPIVARPKRLLVRMPTRQRPAQAIAVLERYRNMAGLPITIEVVVDEDDESMQSPEVIQRLAALGCIITAGRHSSKIEACNGGRAQDWDVLMLASDDMMPVADGYALHVLAAMEEHWPYLDGAVFFSDGYQKSNLCTLPIFGRRLYEQFGYVYDPAYKSLFCDREQTDVLEAIGRIAYIDRKLIEHRHHVWGRAEKDALYERNDALEGADRTTFEARKATRRPYAQIGFDAPPLWLSICICTVSNRRAQFEWLLDYLWNQILPARGNASEVSSVRHWCHCENAICTCARQVEILVDDRRAPVTVGEKRQALLERARGHFVAFIDDDDAVSHDYVARILSALQAMPDADCASLEGIMTTSGAKPERFVHSIKYDAWRTVRSNGAVTYERYPNHLNALRREHALKVGFVSKNVGEDHQFSNAIRPFLKKEASTGDAPLYMYFFNPKQSVQQAPK